MQRPVQLIALADFPVGERAALLALLCGAGLVPQHLCVSRLEPVEDGLPIVTVVSLPGWCRSYEGPEWLAALARDLGSLTEFTAPRERGITPA